TVLLAAWVAPMDSQRDATLIRDGAVWMRDGTINAVGPRAEVLPLVGDAVREELGSVLLTPGLINAHTHLELSLCSRDVQFAGGFTDWILSIQSRLGLSADNRAER